MARALAGDAAPLADEFGRRQAARGPLLRGLLGAQADGPVAACHALIWNDIRPQRGDGLLGHLRWYLREEAGTAFPARAAVHHGVVLRVLMQDGVPGSDAGFDLAFTALRIATDQPVPLSVHRLAAGRMEKLGRAWFKAGDLPLRASMIYAALGTMDLDLIRALVDAAGMVRPPDVQVAIDWGLAQLVTSQGGVDAWLSRTILAEHRRDPENPSSIHRMLWLGEMQDRNYREFSAMVRAMRMDTPGGQVKAALEYARAMAQEHEAGADEVWLTDQLRRLNPDWRDPSATPALNFGLLPAARPAEHDDDLDGCLAAARALAGSDLTLNAAVSPQDLRVAFAALAEAIPTAAVPAHWTLGHFLQAAEAVRQLTMREFSWVAHFEQAPQAGGAPQYGTLDLAFFPVLHHGLLAVAAALCRAGLTWIEAGRGAAGGWALARLVQIHTAAALDADLIETAQAVLDRMASAGVLGNLLATLRDDVHLRAGDLAAARALVPTTRQGSTVHAYLSRQEWSLAEGINWRILASDPPLQGPFALWWPDGRLQTCEHVAPAGTLSLAKAKDISLIAEGLIIGPKGAMLRPDPYHTSLQYPVASLAVLAGQGKAVRIRPAARGNCAEPVLLLDGLAALHWPNYYHWMITHLARIALAAETGALDGRKLVFPEGMRAWTLDSLDLIGVTTAHRMIVDPADQIRFADAAILSSVEHVSVAAIHALRRRLLGDGANALAPVPDGPMFYFSRRSRALRKLANEDEVEAIARDMGFEVVAPEDYTIDEQRRMFARARGLAAPEGAALTNMVFAAPGTRVLSILCQNDMLPIFNDLALVLGQAHRKLAGAGIDGLSGGNRFQPHYHVDPGLVRRALAWVQKGD